jgi:hypothetical protein
MDSFLATLLPRSKSAVKLTVHFSRPRPERPASAREPPVISSPLVCAAGAAAEHIPLANIHEPPGDDGTAAVDGSMVAEVEIEPASASPRRRGLLGRRKHKVHAHVTQQLSASIVKGAGLHGALETSRSSTPEEPSVSSSWDTALETKAARGERRDEADVAEDEEDEEGEELVQPPGSTPDASAAPDDASSAIGSEYSRLATLASTDGAEEWGPSLERFHYKQGVARDLKARLRGTRDRARAAKAERAMAAAAATGGSGRRRRRPHVATREAALAVIRTHAARARERRQEKRRLDLERRSCDATVVDGLALSPDAHREKRRGKDKSFSSSPSKHAGSGGSGGSRRKERSGRGSAPASPVLGPSSRADPACALFTEIEMATAQRLFCDWDHRPSDKPPSAVHASENGGIRMWRWKGEPGPSGYPVDVYESQFEVVGVSADALVATQSALGEERKRLDPSTKVCELLRASGPQELCGVHQQQSDSMAILHVVETPWPLPNREYIIERRICCLRMPPPPPAGGGAGGGGCDGPPRRGPYLRIDRADDSKALWALQPSVAARHLRCIDFSQVVIAWEVTSPSGVPVTRVRQIYREDPMMPLPRWLLALITERMMPKGLKALQKAALERQRSGGEHQAAASSASRHTPPAEQVEDEAR